jgi:succinyl-diaminopimelate desuccinylase
MKSEMLDALMQLISVAAIGPESGGDGESAKANVLSRLLADSGFERVESFDAKDARVASGRRPNIVAYFGKKTGGRRLWIVTHLDVVPSGEESFWKVTKPFEPVLQGNRIFGRGSEDNGQSLVASVFAVKALAKLGIAPSREVALAFVSDEEQGSSMGIQYLLKKRVFGKDDLVLVPDSGSTDGAFIEVAEKSILWFKVVTFGKQTHGSLPDKGLNAHRIGMRVALALDSELHNKYNGRNDYFSVPYSTFEPTKKDKNVDAVNIIPGEDVVYFDCRVLPEYDLNEVLADVGMIAGRFEAETGVKIKFEVLQKQAAPPMPNVQSEVVGLLKEALKRVRGVDAVVGGIGGGTCAAFFRKAGIPAAVWSTIDEVAHQPDEYAKVENLVADAKVFALMAVL